MKCLIATGNPNKVEEIRRLLGENFELLSLADLEPLEEPEETGETFLENAQIKSRYYGRATGIIALADDSGLEIDALDGQPGVHSSRFGGVDTPYPQKMAEIIRLLDGLPLEQRTARFCCVASAFFPDGTELHARGTLEGVIATEPIGDGGFGYDPILFLPELNKSVAQLRAEEKDLLSHRGVAFRQLIQELKACNHAL